MKSFVIKETKNNRTTGNFFFGDEQITPTKTFKKGEGEGEEGEEGGEEREGENKQKSQIMGGGEEEGEREREKVCC